eukprot:gene28466-31613_t
MFRQSSSLAKRLILNAQSEGRLAWNASQFSSKAGAEVASGSQSAVPSVLGAKANVDLQVLQVSSSDAAIMAAKKSYLGSGLSPMSLSGKAFSTSAAAAASSSAAPAAATAALSHEPSAEAHLVMLKIGIVRMTAPSRSWQILFQDSATSQMQAAVDLHHDIGFFLFTIVALVLYMTAQFCVKFHYSRNPIAEKLTHHTAAELVWTIVPTIIVLSIAVPSLTLIYSMDQQTDRPGLTVKIIGRQWYWSYEMHDHLQHKLVDPEKLVSIAEKAIRA